MHNTLRRYISILLVPSLMADPLLAASFQGGLGSRSHGPVNDFACQAINGRLGNHTRPDMAPELTSSLFRANPASLPPPSDNEIQDVPLMSPRDRKIFAALTFAYLGASLSYISYAVLSQDLNSGTFFRFIFLGYVVLMTTARTAGNWGLTALGTQKPVFIPAPPPGTFRLAMITTFVPGKEPLEMLRSTLEGMLEVTYPHDSYVLDEGDSDEVKALVERLNQRFAGSGKRVFHYSRPDKSVKEKGANLTAWLNDIGYSRYDVATFLDSDFRPLPYYLDRVLGYMGKTRKGKKVVFVQSPAPYSNRGEGRGNWISEGAEQTRHRMFGLDLPSFYGQNTPLIIGDHNTIDLKALQEIGGYQVHQADDLLTSKKITAQGYTGVYLPNEVLAYGLGPASWAEHFIQQTKWAYGTVDLQIRHFRRPISGLGLRQHLMWIRNGLGYLFMLDNMAQSLFLLSFLSLSPANLHLGLGMVILFAPVSLSRWARKFWLQKFNPTYPIEGRRFTRLQEWMIGYAAWPYAFRGILYAVQRRDYPRVVTPKSGDQEFSLKLFGGHMGMLALVSIFEVLSLWRGVPGLALVQFYGGLIIFLNAFPIVHGFWMSRQSRHPGGTSGGSFSGLMRRAALSLGLGLFVARGIIPIPGSATPSTPVAPETVNTLREFEPALTQAWVAYADGRWQQARETLDTLEKTCPSCWTQARAIDQALTGAKDSWPLPGRDQTVQQLFERYGVLYQAGAADFIRIHAAMETGDAPQARRWLARILRDLPHAQIYDRRGYFWSPILSIAEEYPAIFRQVVERIPESHPYKNTFRLLSWEGQIRWGWNRISQSRLFPTGIVLGGLALVSRRFRAALGSLIQERPSLSLSIIALTTYWLSPAFTRWVHQLMLGFSPLSVFQDSLLLGLGALYSLQFATNLLVSFWLFARSKEPSLTPLDRNQPDLPRVTIQIPVRQEPFNLIQRAVENALTLHYPRERLEVQVIDDNDEQDPQLRAYCEAMGAALLYRASRKGFKAGGLNFALKQTTGEYLVILDVDSTVAPDILLKGLPYFQADSSLGYTQCHVEPGNEPLNIVTQAVGLTVRANSRIQNTYARFGFVRFDGHNGIIRRKAIEDIGGWPETISEDLEATIRMRLAGYHGRFAGDIQTREDVVENLTELIKQRRKWAFGTMLAMIRYTVPILKSREFRTNEKFSLLLQVSDYPLTALAFVLSFAYIQFAPFSVLLIFLLPQMPMLTTNARRPLHLVKMVLPTAAIMGSLIPHMFLSVFRAVTGLKQGWPITRKQVGNEKQSLDVLIKVYGFPLAAAGLFFGLLPFTALDPVGFLLSFQPSVFMMIVVVITPFLLNFIDKAQSKTPGTSSPDSDNRPDVQSLETASAVGLFFALLPFRLQNPWGYLMSFHPSAILMSSIAATPFITNYLPFRQNPSPPRAGRGGKRNVFKSVLAAA